MNEKNTNTTTELNSNDLLEQVKPEVETEEKESASLVAVIITAVIGITVSAATAIAGYKIGYKKANHECCEQIMKLRAELGLPIGDSDEDE